MITEQMLLVTDGRYIWAHHLGMKVGPLVARLTEDGQIADLEFNQSDPNGLPFNPENCIGGRVHTVENPMFPPSELFEDHND